MEKSGSRASNPEIIDSWRLKSRSRILLESFVTLAFWTGFLYLLIPMVTLLLWIFGFKIAYAELIGAEGLRELVRIIKDSGIIILIITLIIMAWGYYNYLLFRIRGDRRGSRVMICFDEDFANRYHLDLQTLRAAKEEPRLCVTLADEHIAVEPPSGSPVPSAPPGRREH
jgi:poly-beta-1,6-N-acetyl-D-glucosamine biosynthesis protein PgaD